MTTHYAGCYDAGPRHYECALLEVKKLRGESAAQDKLAQPEQEPVAWSYWQSCLNDDGTQTAPWVHRLSKFKPTESIINKNVTPLYTTSPQRTWVGLTEDEIDEVLGSPMSLEHSGLLGFVKDILAKSKEKNT